MQAGGSLRKPRDRRARPPPGRALPSRGPLEAPPTDFFHLYKATYPKSIEYQDRSGVLPPQASVATKNLSGASAGRAPLSRGPLEHPPTDFFRLYKPKYPKNNKYQVWSGVPPPQASIATKNQSGHCSGTLPKGRIPHRWPSSSSRRSP